MKNLRFALHFSLIIYFFILFLFFIFYFIFLLMKNLLQGASFFKKKGGLCPHVFFSFFNKNLVLRTSIFERILPLRANSALWAGNVQPLHRWAGDPPCIELARETGLFLWRARV